MKMALELAEQGRGWTSPNPMVGAVVVKDGMVVGIGFHQAAGSPHAEIHALNDAGEKARRKNLGKTALPCGINGSGWLVAVHSTIWKRTRRSG